MNLVIITGMSGAGKSATLKFYEDFGYYCVDNLPPQLIGNFIEICKNNNEIQNIAIGIDVRGGTLFDELILALEEVDKNVQDEELSSKVIFMDCNNEILVKRFKETRRAHPLSKNLSIIDCILKERKVLAKIRKVAKEQGYIIDTTKLLTRELKSTLAKILNEEKKEFNSLVVSINSFGFKFGIPSDSDLVFDVRFMPNPFYLDDLKEKTGNDQEVRDYVMSFEESQKFLTKLKDMIEFLIPNYVKEGKNLLVVNIGCTGGKHRSVTIANELFEHLLQADGNYRVVLNHLNIQHKVLK